MGTSKYVDLRRGYSKLFTGMVSSSKYASFILSKCDNAHVRKSCHLKFYSQWVRAFKMPVQSSNVSTLRERPFLHQKYPLSACQLQIANHKQERRLLNKLSHPTSKPLSANKKIQIRVIKKNFTTVITANFTLSSNTFWIYSASGSGKILFYVYFSKTLTRK